MNYMTYGHKLEQMDEVIHVEKGVVNGLSHLWENGNENEESDSWKKECAHEFSDLWGKGEERRDFKKIY